MSPDLSKIFKLSVPERVLLVEAIWDSIVGENDKNYSYNLSKEQITILEEELIAYEKNPNEGSSWSEIKNKLSNK